jgi:hypothetical protein
MLSEPISSLARWPSRLATRQAACREGTDRTKEFAMANDPPYHTDSPEYPPENRNVYHDDNDCPDGKRIKPEHRKPGTAGRPRCKACA